ncbi:MAG: M20/M25/M40 family metallo-hydrolase [Elusimicrobiales bacterium]|nr:M20/M25/M40 family metallo-hydrolase [Elusimicrobiales bacterium]
MKPTAAALLLTLVLPTTGLCSGTVRHDISMTISPEDASFSAADSVTLPAAAAGFEFSLHAGLSPVSPDGYELERITSSPVPAGGAINGGTGGAPMERFRVSLPPGVSSFRLSYGGRISHGLREQAQEYARSFSETAGIISSSGCYLSGASGFYPRSAGETVSYSLEVSLPAGWLSVAGGARTAHRTGGGRTMSVWTERNPQDDINLVCGRFTEYSMKKDGVTWQAFLRELDPGLARKYMETAASYSAMYSEMIGPYPYAKFALVENFWETGYGMPSFTLLGPRVIRLPFILNSSYPHEVLHNWWGNGVFVDYDKGNWCEGLTAYLADHLIAERNGRGTEYRRTALKKYADYVKDGTDFPLTGFRSRHSSASEAVGYGKAMMIYHMLRLKLGDGGFLAGLREFYAANKFRAASFADLRAAFEKTSGRDLSLFFSQWTRRAGAPEIGLEKASARRKGKAWSLGLRLAQAQPGEAYALDIPVRVTLADGTASAKTVRLDSSSASFSFSFPSEPLAVEVDPEFDVFRKVSPEETPASLSRILGASKPLILLPPDGERWRELTARWDRDPSNRPVIRQWLPGDPGGSPAWLLASSDKEGPAAGFLSSLAPYGLGGAGDTLKLGGDEFPLDSHTFVFAGAGAGPSALILSRAGEHLSRLAAKLPHYGKYSWLVFDREMNAVKTGTWRPAGSPLVRVLKKGTEPASAGDTIRHGVPVPSAPLGEPAPLFSPSGMQKTAEALAGLEGGRGPGSPGLAEARGLIASAFQEAGLTPFMDGDFRLKGEAGDRRLMNIAGRVRGASLPGEFILISAHYDHLSPDGDTMPHGAPARTYPGANDNASGLAMMLELARHYAAVPPERSVIFAAFDGEEDGRLGSKAFVKALGEERLAKMNAVVNLDTIGKMTSAGPFILGASSSDKWPHILRGASFVTGLPHRVVKEDLDSSDQVSFIEAGVPAIQVFSGPDHDYHKPTDTADKLDYKAMARAAGLVREVTDYLAGTAPFITRPSGAPAASAGDTMRHGVPVPPAPAGTRKVSTGLVPDFAYRGEGVRAADITPGSPLAAAGVKPGAVVKAVGGKPVGGLREYSRAISDFRPGDTAVFTIQAGDGPREIEIKFSER